MERVCDHLADAVADNGSNRPTITKAWRTAARLMLDRDGRTETQVHGAIDWCQADEFWRSNVMSLPKLRQQYDRLRLRAEQQRNRAGLVVVSRQQAHTNDLFDRATQRMTGDPA